MAMFVWGQQHLVYTPYRVRKGHGKPKKNSISRPGKSWNLTVGP